jgi:hypothetical protein
VLGCAQRSVRRLGVAEVPLIDGVAGRHFVDQRRALRLRLGAIDHGGQQRIVDHHGFGSVLGLRQALRDHHHDRIADITDLAGGERRMRGHLHRRAILGVDYPAADQIADLVGGKLRAGEHREHARARERGFRIDALDGRMRMWRAHEHRMGLPGAVDVIGVMAVPRDETLILLAADRRTDSGRTHDKPPLRTLAAGLSPSLTLSFDLLPLTGLPPWPWHLLRSPSRCCGSRYSGRCCLPAHGEWCARRGRCPCGSRYRPRT